MAWRYPRDLPDPLLRNIAREESHSVYIPQSDDPRIANIEVLMIHDPRKKTKYQYHTNILLSACLESFSCVVNLVSIPASQSVVPGAYGPYAPAYAPPPSLTSTITGTGPGSPSPGSSIPLTTMSKKLTPQGTQNISSSMSIPTQNVDDSFEFV